MGTSDVRVMVTIDVEEDDWGSYAPAGASTGNIERLPELCEILRRHGAKPTLFVNRPPLISAPSVRILGDLARDAPCEIATHCHAWNTPPIEGPAGRAVSMMFRHSPRVNGEKIAEVHRLLETELGVRPTSFRAGRWGFGPSVAAPLAELGYTVDASVTPTIDWTPIRGPDYSRAPRDPYRFDPADPLTPTADGILVEIPTTIGFLRGDQTRAARARTYLERSPVALTKLVGLLDGLGILTRRWLSPETATAQEMVALARTLVRRQAPVLDMTLHSCTLLPAATPFVRDEHERVRFLSRIDRFLAYCVGAGFTFATAREVAASLERPHGEGHRDRGERLIGASDGATPTA